MGLLFALVGFGPVVLTVVVAALAGVQMSVGWGTWLLVLRTFWLVPVRPESPWGRAAFASILVQLMRGTGGDAWRALKQQCLS